MGEHVDIDITLVVIDVHMADRGEETAARGFERIVMSVLVTEEE